MRTIHWQLGWSCNLRCRYCWNETRPQVAAGLAAPRMLEVVDEIATASVAAGRESQLILTGGEPLLSPVLLPLVERALSAGLAVSVLTNATLLTTELMARLVALSAAHGDPPRLMLIISLDAVDARVNELTRKGTASVLAAIAALAAPGCPRAKGRRAVDVLPTMMNTVLTRENIDHIEPLLELSSRSGFVEHRLDPAILFPPERYPADLALDTLPPTQLVQCLDRLEATLHRYRAAIRLLPPRYYADLGRFLRDRVPPPVPCGAGDQLLVIDPWGRVLPCFERAEVLADLSREPFGALRPASLPAPERCLTPRCVCSFIQHPHRIAHCPSRASGA